jgi:uncharacterized protein DUF6496
MDLDGCVGKVYRNMRRRDGQACRGTSLAATGDRPCAATKEFDMTSRYGKKAGDKVHATVHEMEHGTLKTGSGKKVTSRKQAIAIGLNEARKEGGKVPGSGSH